MHRQIISRAPKEGLPFSVAVGYGPFVFLSGLVGRDPAGALLRAGGTAAGL